MAARFCFVFLLVQKILLSNGNPINDSTDYPVQSQEIDQPQVVSVWTGQTLAISCEDDKHLAPYYRLWRKGSDLLSAANVIISLDHRVRVVNEHVLEIENVTHVDEGQYTCEIVAKPIVLKTFQVSIVEVICGEPDQIAHGGMNPSPGTVETFRYGDQVVYFCNEGYLLLGNPVRTCLHPGTGWEAEVPRCELQEVAAVSSRISTLEDKFYKLFNADMETFVKVEAKFSDLEERVKLLEGDADVLRNGRSKNEFMEREVHHLKKALGVNAVRESWEKFLNADVAHLGVSDGHVVSEYTWLVPEFDEKMEGYRDLNFDYIQSRPFYTNIPGYQMILHIYPNYDQTNHVGFYAVLIPGKFDDVIAWPFTSKYMLSIGSFNPDESDVYDTIVPARITSCRFERPPPNNDIGCGFASFLDFNVLRHHGHLHKVNGGLLFRISIFLDD